MVRWLVVAAAVLGACGRFNFDEVGGPSDGRSGDGGTTAAVQHGVVTLAGAEILVPIATVIPDRAMLLFGVAGSALEPASGLVSGHLSSSSMLRFIRQAPGPTLTIVWHLVEWKDIAVQVQAGLASPTAGQRMITLPIQAIDKAITFPILSWHTAGMDFSGNDVVRARFASPTTLELGVGAGAGDLPGTIAYQVVSIPTSTVVSAEVSLSATDKRTTISVPEIDNPVLFARWQQDDLTASIGTTMLDATIDSPTQLGFERGIAGDPIEVAFFMWSFPGAHVQRGTVTIPPMSDGVIIPLSPAVDPSRSFAFLGGNERVAATESPGIPPGDNAGVAWFTSEITSPTSLRLKRGAIDATAAASWYVVELP